jgi:hypothetical protein
MAMKIPFFHRDDKEDVFDIKEMIQRFKNSADTMGFADNAGKCNMFANYLRGPAAVLWEGMEFYRESKVDWNRVKKYFLKQYQGEVNVETFTFKIAKLIQGSNKSGTKLVSEGIYPLPFTIDGRQFENNVHMFSNLNEGMILRINFLSKNGI